MKDVNVIFLTGRLTKDSELRATTSGKHIQSFSIASNDDYKKLGSDEWTNKCYFINCVKFGNTLGLDKGVAVSIQGKLTSNTVEKDGVKRTYIQVEVINLNFIVPKEKVEKVEEVKNEELAEKTGNIDEGMKAMFKEEKKDDVFVKGNQDAEDLDVPF